MNGNFKNLLPSTNAFNLFWSLILHSAQSVSVRTHLANDILELNLLPNVQRPILIQNAIPESERRQWWKHIQTRSKNEVVLVDTQTVSVNENEDEDDNEAGKSRLVSALERVQASIRQKSRDPIYVESIGSSCSMDQLPIYEYCQSFFGDSDILSNFSPHTPMHEQLIISSNQARSTMSSRCYTTTSLCIGGGPIEYRMEAISQENIAAYKGTRAIARTWEGDAFNVGWNSMEGRLWDSENLGNIVSARVLPGDILVLPRNWWFQSQSQRAAANISVFSKRCGSGEFEQLVQDILPPKLANKMLLTLGSAGADDDDKYQMLFDSIKLQYRGEVSA